MITNRKLGGQKVGSPPTPPKKKKEEAKVRGGRGEMRDCQIWFGCVQ